MIRTLDKIWEDDKVLVQCCYCKYPRDQVGGKYFADERDIYSLDGEFVCEDCMKTVTEEVEREPTYNELLEEKNK